jgi:putative ABC transport system substrate-binding protein
LGWTDGRNVQIETRWAGSHASDIRRHATDLVALAPDVIFAYSVASLEPLLQATHTVPIVFAAVPDRDLSQWRGSKNWL